MWSDEAREAAAAARSKANALAEKGQKPSAAHGAAIARAAGYGDLFSEDEIIRSPSAAGAALAQDHPKSSGTFVSASRGGYSPEAVNKAIAASNRSGQRISGREAKMIHALLKGRH